jgi:DNA-binding response OmpR family regulator
MTDKVKGLNLGADDYITKPFEGVELVARVRAVLRRKGREVIDGFDDINVNIAERRVYKSGQEVDLTPKEYDLLILLLENRNIALTREKILDLVWGYEFEGATRTVDVHIQRLRSKLRTDRIKTIVKIGYRLEC